MSQLTVEDVKGYDDDIARALIAEAKNREVLDRDKSIPSDPAKLHELADTLVQLSLDEWYRSTPAELRGQIGNDVKALLGIVGIVPDGEELKIVGGPLPAPANTEDDGLIPVTVMGAKARWAWDDVVRHVVENGNTNLTCDDVDDAQKLDALLTEKAQAEPEPEQEAPAALEEPWDGYDADIVPNILKKLHEYNEAGVLDDNAIEYVLKYERANKNRKGIIELLDPPEQTSEEHAKLDEEADAAIAADPDPEPGVMVHNVVEEARKNGVDSLGDPIQEEAPDEPAEEPVDAPATEPADDRPTHLAGVQEASSFLSSFKNERLPEPQHPNFVEDPVLPGNIADLGDSQLQQLYMDFGACLSRANWLLGLAQAEESRLERIAKRERAKAIMRHKDVKPEQVRNATVDQDDEVVRWEDAHNEAEQQVKGYTKLSSSYQGNVDRLSRIMAFRLAEAERSKA